MTDFASLADRIAADNEGKAFWLPDVGRVRNVTLSLDEIDKVIEALHLAAETHNALVEPASQPHEGRFDVMDTIDPDYAASFERERCQLCGSSNGHLISCVKIQRDHVDVAPAQQPGIDPDLVQRAKELLEWGSTGLLHGGTGGALRAYADRLKDQGIPDSYTLSVAETKTRDEAMAALIKLAALSEGSR